MYHVAQKGDKDHIVPSSPTKNMQNMQMVMNKNMMVMCLSAHQLHVRKATNLSSYPLELGWNVTSLYFSSYACTVSHLACCEHTAHVVFSGKPQTSRKTNSAFWSPLKLAREPHKPSFFYVHHSQMKQERFLNSKMWCCLPPEMSLRPPSSGSNSMLLSSCLDATTYWYQHLLGFPVKPVGNRICLSESNHFFQRLAQAVWALCYLPTLML